MKREPWFKFFASDYLLDDDVDRMSLADQALLVRIWCICHIDGFCPADPEELARKIRCNLQSVLQFKQHCQSYIESHFDLHDDRMYSRRMQEEKKRSRQASSNANQRWNKRGYADGNADGKADGKANTHAQSQSQSQIVELDTNNQNNSFQSQSAAEPMAMQSAPEGLGPDGIAQGLVKLWQEHGKLGGVIGLEREIAEWLPGWAKQKGMTMQQVGDYIREKLEVYLESPLFKSGNGRYPHFWFKDGHWDDDPKLWQTDGRRHQEETGKAEPLDPKFYAGTVENWLTRDPTEWREWKKRNPPQFGRHMSLNPEDFYRYQQANPDVPLAVSSVVIA